jgi:hypothetical protein
MTVEGALGAKCRCLALEVRDAVGDEGPLEIDHAGHSLPRGLF